MHNALQQPDVVEYNFLDMLTFVEDYANESLWHLIDKSFVIDYTKFTNGKANGIANPHTISHFG